MELAMVDDQVVPIDRAMVSAHDRCVYFGDGVYEVVMRCNGRLFEMERHMARLERSLREMDMLDRVDMQLISRRVARAVRESKLDDARVYFQITRGSARRAHDYGADWQPGFLLTVTQKGPGPAETATAITYPDLRWKRCDIKSLNLLANVMAKHAATKAGAHDAILVDEEGLITEASSSSVLMVKDNVLRGAPLTANILPSVTRALLLGWAGEVGLEVREESFTVAEALAADELMLAGTGQEVMGITHLNGEPIGAGERGAYTARLKDRLVEAMCG